MGFSGLSVSDFLIRCNTIRNAVKNNPAEFPAPDPTDAVLEASIGNLATRQEQVENIGGKDNTILRNEAKNALMDNMRTLAIYVSGVANGNTELILLSGFDIVGAKHPVGILPPPNGLKAKADGLNLGSIQASCKGVNGSTGYMMELSLMVDGVPELVKVEKAKRLGHLFTGLTSGAQYRIRACTLSSAGQGAWGGPVFHRPQ